MEEKGQQGKDRVSPASVSALPLHGADEGLMPDNYIDKPLSPKDERIVSPDPSLDAASMASSVNPPPEQTYFYGASGYDDGSVNWGEYTNYVHANNLQIVPPAIYNDNASVLFQSPYGFDAYGQFSPVASPLSPIMIDGQLFSPNYYSQPVSPHVTSAGLATDVANGGQEGLGYYLHYAPFGSGNSNNSNNNNNNNNNVGLYKYPGDIESMSNRAMSSDNGGGLYASPVGILGSYDHIFGQTPQQQQQQTAYGYGYGYGSVTTRTGSYRGYNYGEGSRGLIAEKGGKHHSESHSDRNRGPRALKPKGNNNNNHSNNNSNSAVADGKNEVYNRVDFVTAYENAKFFVIKSFSEDNVHKSIKYGVWASTPLGNRKLDAAYQEAKEAGGTCPVFLFFSVNASGQFCGVAEMVGPVDFVNDAEYWQQDRWNGQFRVKWHIIKDVPNSRFRHFLVENNDNKPVTHSRDSQEVKLEVGIGMLKIFKDHEADTSILDDFSYYDEREKDLQEKKSKERDLTTTAEALADKVAQSLHMEQ